MFHVLNDCCFRLPLPLTDESAKIYDKGKHMSVQHTQLQPNSFPLLSFTNESFEGKHLVFLDIGGVRCFLVSLGKGERAEFLDDDGSRLAQGLGGRVIC